MANHAYVVPDQLPSVETIDADIREIVKNKFPMFQVEYNPKEKLWWINLNGDGYFCLQCWVGEYGLEEDYDEENDRFRKETPCVEFRHGHCCDMLWWIEEEIRSALAAKYQAKQYDDGTGDYVPKHVYNCEKRTETFKEYLAQLHHRHPEYADLILSEHKDFLPDALKVFLE